MKKKNSFIYKILIFTLICSLFTIPTKRISANTSPPSVNAEGVVILDGTTGQVLYSKNGDTKFEPASTTKVMTALLVLENVTDLNEKVTVGKKPPLADGSSLGLKADEIITVEELLLGLLLESGNDCAETLAEHVSGSSEKFAELMTKRALELGAKNTTFKNPSGLHEEGHITTAYDLSLIMSEAIKKPEYVRLSQTIMKQLDAAERWVNNGNLLLNKNSKYYYKYAIAAKKGYTPEAKFTNVAAAKKDGKTLVTAILRDSNQYTGFSELASLFDYGFDNFTLTKVYEEGEKVGSITLPGDETANLLIGRDVYYSVKKNEENKIKADIKFDLPTIKTSSIKRGDTLSTGTVLVNDTEIAQINLVSDTEWKSTPSKALNNILKENKVAIICSMVALLIILLLIRKNNIKKRRRQAFRNKFSKASSIRYSKK